MDETAKVMENKKSIGVCLSYTFEFGVDILIVLLLCMIYRIYPYILQLLIYIEFY